ncbi:MAG: phage major capsid protein [Elusimicrobia bacterium]|nr:phage major capsid protein [Elusimicrobiota bacterium]
MNDENKPVTGNAPAENGLKDVSEKLDTVLAAAEAAGAKAAEAQKRAEEAEKRAQEAEARAAKMQDELTAAKNTHPINFAPAAQETEKSADAKDFKKFLNDVKAAHFGGSKAALQSGAATGSYLVPKGFLPEVLDLLGRSEDLISKVRRLPWGVDGNTRDIPNLVSRSAWSLVGEGAKKGVSNPTFGTITQKLAKMATIVIVTEELLSDTSVDLPALFADQARAGLVDKLNDWLFNGNGSDRAGILSASGVHTPTVTGITDLLLLKQAVPSFVARSGSFYVDTALYNQLASLSKQSAPAWLYYEGGKMKIDNSDVVALDTSLIGARKAVFGDLGNVIFSPKTEFDVRYTDVATITEGSGDSAVEHHLFQENKQAYRFEMRADLTVIGSVWAKATVPAPAA